MTSGEVAMCEDVATLKDVCSTLGDSAAINWLSLQLYRLEESGALTLCCDKKEQNRIRRETAQMIVALYGHYNLAELSLFFARYISAEFDEATKAVYGASKVYVALKAYNAIREADIRRLQREADNRAYIQLLEKAAMRAISYDDYVRSQKGE